MGAEKATVAGVTASPAPRAQLPPRLLPVLYFGVAHVALAFAFGAVALDPRGVSGFFYHSRMLGIVHLVTLGWITASILGSLYVLGPIALRVWIPATWLDYTAFALVLIGIIGMVAHFWIQEYGGMAWSAITVGAGIVAGRRPRRAGVCVRRRCRAPSARTSCSRSQRPRRRHPRRAASGSTRSITSCRASCSPMSSPTRTSPRSGWATMMVVGVAYRLLPMILPAAMPGGRALWLSAVLLQAGVTGLFVTLLLRSPLAWIFALTIVGAFAAFVSQVVWMLRRPRPRPPGVRTPDPAVLHAGASFASLGLAAVLGLWLTVAEPSPATLRIAMAYGVFGLVGFLAQMVVGMEGRLLPIFAWYWAYANTGYRVPCLRSTRCPGVMVRSSCSCCGCSASLRWRAASPSMPSRSSAPARGACWRPRCSTP